MKHLKILILVFTWLMQTQVTKTITDSSGSQQKKISLLTPNKIPDLIKDSVFNKGLADSFYTMLSNKVFVNQADFDSLKCTVGKFDGTIFQQDAEFANAKFRSFADFSGVTFCRDANFSSAVFQHFLFLSGIYTDTVTEFYFYNACLPPIVDFSHNINLHRDIDFSSADFDSLKIVKKIFHDRRIFINLYNTDINRVKMDYLHFRLYFCDPAKPDKILFKLFNNKHYTTKDSSLFFNSPEVSDYIQKVFPNMNINNRDVRAFIKLYFINNNGRFPASLTIDQIDAVYSRLLHNFEVRGQEDSREQLDVEYQDFRWEKNGILGWCRFFPKWWDYYGNENNWILYWTPALLLALTLITFFSYNKVFSRDNTNKVIYHLENIPDNSTDGPNTWKIELRNAAIFTCVIFFSFGLKTEKLDFKRPTFFYIIVINGLGLLCLAYLANFILQK